MKTIVLLGQKGGSGKTTLAINLAVAAQMQGERVCLLDTDPQKSALQWAQTRKSNVTEREDLAPIHTMEALPSQIEVKLNQARLRESTLCIIDTAPHLTPAATQLASQADLAIVPCRPTALDLGTMESTTNVLNAANAKSMVVLTGCHHRCGETHASRDSLINFGLTVCPVSIGDRIAFSRSIASGKSVLDLVQRRYTEYASAEVLVLWDYIFEVLRGKRKIRQEKSERH